MGGSDSSKDPDPSNSNSNSFVSGSGSGAGSSKNRIRNTSMADTTETRVEQRDAMKTCFINHLKVCFTCNRVA